MNDMTLDEIDVKNETTDGKAGLERGYSYVEHVPTSGHNKVLPWYDKRSNGTPSKQDLSAVMSAHDNATYDDDGDDKLSTAL